ncbi:erythromycin esterase family protein [Chryseobacterium hagamense]|uniref:Succinoglycan biosynthesis protein n=1 Tax=Chryseobacterium hagamense TaxID=395935 RepID=A0A511YR32_9FLAO|nr:erythromycin esterase family protein [Chryseobacterium hagamense]GEN77651.1 succinoglycan biosynthesis protein [Chryseobacterium hagamense]
MKKIFPGNVLLLGAFLFSTLICSQSAVERNYLRKFIHPLQSYDADTGFKEDSLVFNRFFANVKIIGLGEASHGSSEIFKLKDKLTRYILMKNNGGVFSIESPMPKAMLINEYIVNGKKTGKEYVMNLDSWIYQTDEILDMTEWMKKYNDRHASKITFTGFDMTTYRGSVVQFKIIMDKYNVSTDHLMKLTQLLHEENQLEKKQLSRKKQIHAEASTELDHIRNFLPNISGPDDYSWFAQHLVLLEQYIHRSYLDRNRYMAENIAWLKNKYPESAFVLWAHNEHLKKTGAETGRFLIEKFKDDYTSCGTFFYEGSHSVIGLDDKKITPAFVKKNTPDSLEELLNSFNIPIFILDLKSIKKENNELTKVLLKKINYRTVGASPTSNDFKSGNITDDFDYLIFIKNSTASKLLSN